MPGAPKRPMKATTTTKTNETRPLAIGLDAEPLADSCLRLRCSSLEAHAASVGPPTSRGGVSPRARTSAGCHRSGGPYKELSGRLPVGIGTTGDRQHAIVLAEEGAGHDDLPSPVILAVTVGGRYAKATRTAAAGRPLRARNWLLWRTAQNARPCRSAPCCQALVTAPLPARATGIASAGIGSDDDHSGG